MAEVLSRVMKRIGLRTESWKVPVHFVCLNGHIENGVLSHMMRR